jgi:hypothetical protein
MVSGSQRTKRGIDVVNRPKERDINVSVAKYFSALLPFLLRRCDFLAQEGTRNRMGERLEAHPPALIAFRG